MPNIKVKFMAPSSLAQYSESCQNSLLFAIFHLITHPFLTHCPASSLNYPLHEEICSYWFSKILLMSVVVRVEVNSPSHGLAGIFSQDGRRFWAQSQCSVGLVKDCVLPCFLTFMISDRLSGFRIFTLSFLTSTFTLILFPTMHLPGLSPP